MKNVKQWAIIAWTGGVGLALGNQSLKASIWATVFVPLTFWIVDGSYRRIQRSFVMRIHEISNFVNSAEFLEAAARNRTFDFPVMTMRSKAGKRTDVVKGHGL